MTEAMDTAPPNDCFKDIRLLRAGDLCHPHTEAEIRSQIEAEMTFRRGFYYGVDSVVEAMKRGCSLRQMAAWCDSVIFKWWHKRIDIHNHFSVPSPPEPWRRLRAQVLAEKGTVCTYCGEPATEVDHVVPLCRGGSEDMGNLVPCCSKCNRSKWIKTLEEWQL